MTAVLLTITKRKFNPSDLHDLLEYKYFKNKGTWQSSCPFVLEWPYVNVPMMLDDLIVNHYLASISTIK